MSSISVVNPLHLKFKHSDFLSYILFYISFWGYTGSQILSMTTIGQDYPDINKILLRIGWCCVILAVVDFLFLTDYPLYEIAIYSLFLLLLYLSYRNCGNRYFLQSFPIVLSARQTEWKKVIKNTLIFYFLLLTMIFLFYQIGLTHELDFYKNGILRRCLGFYYPNTLGHTVMVFAMIWIAARYDKLKLYDYVVMAAIAVFVWKVPNSRTSALIVIILMVLTFVLQKWGDILLNLKAVHIFCLLAYPICFLFTFITDYFYNDGSTFLVKLNSVLSGRVSLGHTFLEKYSLTLMGQKVKMVDLTKAAKTGEQYLYLDSGYMRLALCIGIIGSIIALLVLLGAIEYSICEKNWGILIGLLLFSIYGISEASITYVFRNVFMIAFAYVDFADIWKLRWKITFKE